MSASISKLNKLVALANPDSPRTEAYRALRTSIQFAAESEAEGNRQILMFTSAKAGEGKSTTIGNLAVLYAQAGKKVLLIDANLRDPALHRLFGVSNRLGLTSILEDVCPADHAVQEMAVPKLYLVPAGPQTAYPSEMLGGGRLRQLLADLRGEYDLILVDASAMLSVSDAQVLSACCDGVVFVIRPGKVKEKEAQQAMTRLEQARANVVGVVMNRR